jgi:restriction endonuclease S subunit
MGETILKEDLVENGVIPVFSATESDKIFGFVNNVKLLLQENDLIIPARGNSIGHLMIVKGLATCTQTTIYFKNKSNIESKFAFYFAKGNQNILFQYDNTAIPQITVNQTKNNVILIPPYYEQTAIANYLDQKTTQIDHLIAKKEQFIQLLEEERVAVINQAVTKGLDPNVAMNDSGVKWLGEIPEHWEVKKLKYVCSIISNKAKTKPNFVLALENIESWTGKIVGDPYSNSMEGEVQLFQEGDILFNKLRPYLAKVCLAKKEGGAIGELLVLRPYEIINSGFLFQRLRSEMIITIVDGSTYGTKMPRASWDKFISQLEIGVPTLGEQIKIENYIVSTETRIRKLTSKTQQEIELLKEYKTALISEVVTGKVDVRDEKLN